MNESLSPGAKAFLEAGIRGGGVVSDGPVLLVAQLAQRPAAGAEQRDLARDVRSAAACRGDFGNPWQFVELATARPVVRPDADEGMHGPAVLLLRKVRP